MLTFRLQRHDLSLEHVDLAGSLDHLDRALAVAVILDGIHTDASRVIPSKIGKNSFKNQLLLQVTSCIPVLQPFQTLDEGVQDLGTRLGRQVVQVGEDTLKFSIK